MSLLGKKWVIKNTDDKLPLIERLLTNRAVLTDEDRQIFLDGGMEQLHDPMLLTDMDKAIRRVQKAIDSGEEIMVFGDYDVDGITGTAVLYDFLKSKGANVAYTLPNRENDGYGLKDYFIKKFKKDGVSLIITVDCGTANYKEIKIAKELGIDTVVTDHHTMPKVLPSAVAIINPHRPDCDYPNKEISGSGISYKLVSAMTDDKEYLRKQLGIAALGIVADCMSMLSPENRSIVKEGLASLSEGSHPGISHLLEESGANAEKITSTTVGFQIGPRINAAGRMDKPDHALELILGNVSKVTLLNRLNTQRRAILEAYMKGVYAYLDSTEIPNIIVILSKEWRSGLLGLIASRVVDSYHRPTIVMQDRDDELVASMRSLGEFDITDCMRSEISDLCTAFGGHAMAGGFTLPKKNLKEFLARVRSAAKTSVSTDKFVSTLNIDCVVNYEDISMETIEQIGRLEPFGPSNPEPTLLIKSAQIKSIRAVGKQKEHLQFPVEVGDKSFKAIAFRFGEHLAKIDPALSYDVAFNVEVNEWNGRRDIQLKVVDLKPSDD